MDFIWILNVYMLDFIEESRCVFPFIYTNRQWKNLVTEGKIRNKTVKLNTKLIFFSLAKYSV